MSNFFFQERAYAGVQCQLSLPAAERLAGDDAAGRGVHWTTDLAAELPVKVRAAGPGSEAPLTVMDMWAALLAHAADRPALMHKTGGQWRSITWRAYFDEACLFARAAIHAGLGAHQGVCVLGFNAPQWFMANMGAIFAGGVPAGIYTTNGPEACRYVADNCEARIAVVEDALQLSKFLEVRAALPHLKALVVWSGELPPGVGREQGVYTWADFLRLGSLCPPSVLSDRMAAQRPGHCATLIYTSGTTGLPKGVMLSHDNLTWTARVAANSLSFGPDEHAVSFLPLSHIAAQMTDMYVPLHAAATVWFAQPDALKGTLGDTLKEVRPTKLFAVPRVWEKVEERMRAVGAANTGLKKALGDWAKRVGTEGNRALREGQSLPWGWTVANALVFNNVKKAIGLDRCTLMLSGAAPIALSTLTYFESLDITIRELYGMSESSGPHTISTPGLKMGSVGTTMEGVETLLATPHGDPTGEGEICFRGRHVFMGYLKNEKATREAIDALGFLHSGDVGRIDKDGFVFITGRIKELIITAGGENIPPVLIENAVKENVPALANCMLVGDKRKFLAALLTLKCEVDERTGEPLDQLSEVAVREARAVGSSATTIAEARCCGKFLAMVQAGIDKYNKTQAISRAQAIQKWRILEKDFSIPGGELTPTLKTKRKVVAEKYAREIDAMYAEGPPARL